MTLEAIPLSGAMGAEIHGANVRDISDELFADIHKILLDHGMIFFRDQDITPTQQLFCETVGRAAFSSLYAWSAGSSRDHRDREKPGGYAHIRRLAYRSDVRTDAAMGERCCMRRKSQ